MTDDDPTTLTSPGQDPKTQDPSPHEEEDPTDPTFFTEEQVGEIKSLHLQGRGMRKIAIAVGSDRKTVRRILQECGLIDPTPKGPRGGPSKLDPFREAIREKVGKRLTISRREDGYTGSRTILAEFVRTLAPAAKPLVKRRFETGPGRELQVDWSVYTVPISGTPRRVHALLCVLAYSRYLHVGFYRDERQSTLFEGLARAFDAFQGVAHRVVFDNMTTVVLVRIGKDRKPLWHPRILDFARHYGFEPFACRVRDPNRKGKDEKTLYFLETDFVRGSRFESFEDLQSRAQIWADTIANRRVHGTTRRVPADAWREERDMLVKLPDTRFAVHEETVRDVGPAATISVRGTLYTVPHTLANQSVAVRLFAEHFEVLNRQGQVVLSCPYVSDEDKGKLQIEPSHYLTLPGSGAEHRLVSRTPSSGVSRPSHPSPQESACA